MRKYFGALGFICIGLLIGAIKLYFFGSDADKKADHDAMLDKVLSFAGAHDKSGQINRALAYESLMGSLFLSCKKNAVSTDASTPLTEDDKNEYCGCVIYGANQLYFSTLSDSDLIAQSKLPEPANQSPVAIRKKVYADCNASPDAYKAPESAQP